MFEMFIFLLYVSVMIVRQGVPQIHTVHVVNTNADVPWVWNVNRRQAIAIRDNTQVIYYDMYDYYMHFYRDDTICEPTFVNPL